MPSVLRAHAERAGVILHKIHDAELLILSGGQYPLDENFEVLIEQMTAEIEAAEKRKEKATKAARAKWTEDREDEYRLAVESAEKKIASGEWPNGEVKHHGDMARALMEECPGDLSRRELKKRLGVMLTGVGRGDLYRNPRG